MSQTEFEGLDALKLLAEKDKFIDFLDWAAQEDPEEKFNQTDLQEQSPASRNTVGSRGGYADAAVALGVFETDGHFYSVIQDSPVLEALREANRKVGKEGDLDDIPWN